MPTRSQVQVLHSQPPHQAFGGLSLYSKCILFGDYVAHLTWIPSNNAVNKEKNNKTEKVMWKRHKNTQLRQWGIISLLQITIRAALVTSKVMVQEL